MSIINITPIQVGLVGVLPSIAYIQTNSPLATVLTTGFLNDAVQNGTSFQLPCLAIVSTNESPTDPYRVGTFQVAHVGLDWSLVSASSPAPGVVTLPTVAGNLAEFTDTIGTLADSGVPVADLLTLALDEAHIWVGSALNEAEPVEMSQDATMNADGEVTIANDAITTAKILDANVTLAKLAAGIAPSHVIKFGGQVSTSGGAAAEAFTVTGAAAATDRAFVQLVDDGPNNVSVLLAVVTNNTLTVTFSADPGAGAVINYQLIRAAA